MYFNKLILGLMIAFAIQTLSIKPAWAIKKRLQSTHAERLSKLTNDPLESADFLNSGWLHEASIAVLDKTGRDDPQILWRRARSIINQGENLPPDQAIEYYQRALEIVELAVEKNDEHPNAQEVLAVACGRVSPV